MYILVCVQNGNTPLLKSYTNLNEALAEYHTELAYRHESRTSTMAMVIDGKGRVLKREEYIANAPQAVEGQEGE